jgi:hypothetical protein
MLSQNQETIQMEYFERIVEKLRQYTGVTVPPVIPSSRTSVSSGFRMNNKIFAMISPKGQFAVKLPRKRVKVLVDGGIGEHFDPNQGWLMREWFVVDPAYFERWWPLALEAIEYVNSQG